MKVDSRDVPEAAKLARIRRVVEAVAKGARDARRVSDAARVELRDARYHLRAAVSALGLLKEEGGGFALTALGDALCSTQRGSAEEHAVLVDAVRESAVITELAGDLLGPRKPTLDKVVRRMVATGLSEMTAKKRAKQLLGWREQIKGGEQTVLDYGEAAPRVTGVREETGASVRRAEPAVSELWLASLRLLNFKSFADERIDLAPLTIFVGANASGKSNALDAIRFLQGVALGYSISDVLRGRHEGGRAIWEGIRGGIAETPRSGEQHFEIEATWKRGKEELKHQLGCTTNPLPMVRHESLATTEARGYLFDTHAGALRNKKGLADGHAINVALKRTGPGRSVSQCHSSASSLLGQLSPAATVLPLVYRKAEAVRAAMRRALFLSISPAAMRSYGPRQARELGADGANIAAIVSQLADRQREKERLVDWLSELCAPELADIAFTTTELDEVMLMLVESDGTRISAKALSDGTLRFLGELVALITAPPGSILLIEEIENGLHPQRLHLLVGLLEGLTRERGIQVIATTHSPTVLRELSEDALANVVLFAREHGHEGSVVRRLGELPHFNEVRERRGVDELFATGWLERAL